MNERAARDAFREAVVRYCNRANAAGLRLKGTTVRVTVVTAETLSRPAQEWMHGLATAHVKQMLRDAEDVVVAFPENPALPEPGYQFIFYPLALPAPRGAPRDTEPVVSSPPSGPVALLTLRYDADFEWPCRIGAATGWLAVGRWTGMSVAGPAAMRLPTYATWLPRGGLLLVRNHSGRFAFGRSSHRPRYQILIDGASLRPGSSVMARDEGSIEYAADGSSTLLTYRVDWEGRHGR